MMLLIVAASLVGISSNSIYQPANVKSQPQQPQQQPQPKQRIEGLLTREQGGAGQYMADTELVDRIMPLIVKRIDDKTLAQKIDVATLLQKIDAKTLAAKVLPYLDIKVVVTDRPGQTSIVKIGTLNTRAVGQTFAGCNQDETVVSGGFYNEVPQNSEADPLIFEKVQNQWKTAILFTEDGKVHSYANCLKVGLGLKEEQQLEQLPPGGPPLQPPQQ
jgi:hypothetical protein